MNNKKNVALIIGIIGLLIFCIGLNISLHNSFESEKMKIGIIVGIIGLIICILNYPIYTYIYRKTKTRKIIELRKAGFKVLKKHYFILIATCIISANFGVEFVNSFTLIKTPRESVSDVIELTQVIQKGEFDEVNKKLQDELEETKEKTKNNIFAKNKGVISDIINGVTNGVIFYNIIQVMNTITGSSSNSLIYFLVVFFSIYLALWYFVLNTIPVITRRIFLEARKYEKVSFRNYLFLIKTRKMINVASVMFRKFLYMLLWGVTIIMPFIKMYSYKMVEFILAENPTVKPKEAITLSRKMMDGHKMEALMIDLSFIHWELLGAATLGISKILFVNSYKTAVNTEFYYDIRKQAIENKIEGYELLNDKYLYEYADKEEVREKYLDYYNIVNEDLEPIEKRKGIIGFIENNFGITFEDKEYNEKFKKKQFQEYIKEKYNDLIEGKKYPNKLCPTHISEKNNNADYLSRYSLISLLMMFFIIAMFGWIWEVILIYIQSGIIANRGAMFGPWLPIYGVGSVLAIIMGYRFRKKPFKEFIFILVMCGILEYLTSYFLELSNGLRWWDYTGSFLNINGRICLEGLLTFGIGGSAMVYLVAPFIDKCLSKVKLKTVITIATTFTIFFAMDLVYSNIYPNTGEGITSKLYKELDVSKHKTIV